MTNIPWIPILSGAANLMGSLFGNQKNQTQSENSATTGSQVTNAKTNASQSTTQSQNQQQSSNQDSVQSSAETVGTTTQQRGNTSRLDSTTLGSLTDAVRSALNGGTIGAGSQAAKDRLATVQSDAASFDADAYVQGIMAQTSARLGSDLESGGNQIAGQLGARGSTNSAAALLQAKLNRQGAAELAGVNSQAVATAAEIKRQEQESKTGQITNLAAQTDSQIGNILGALLQANESSTNEQIGSQQTSGSTTGNTSGTTSSVTQSAEQQNSSQTQQQATNSAETTIGKINANSGSTNWGDFFTNIGKMFGASFNGPAGG